jgi:hypothetical protein
MRKPVKRKVQGIKRENTPVEKQPILDTTLIISFLTIFGYYLAFEYQRGYRNYYGLSNVFLGDITLLSVLIAIASISIVSLSIYSLYKFWDQEILYKAKTVFGFIFYRLILFPVLVGYIIFIFSPKEKEHIFFSACITFMILFFNFFPPIFRREKGYINKLVGTVKYAPKTFFEKAILTMKANKKAIGLFATLIFILSTSTARLIGEGSASKREKYLIIKTPAPFVVIDEEKNNLIIAPIDLETKTITPKYQIIEPKSSMKEPLIFEAMRFEDGLKVKEIKNSEEWFIEELKPFL